MRDFDRQETEEQIRLAVAALARLHSMFAAIPEQLPSPLSGSILDDERRYAAREPIDTLVMAHRARAMENLSRAFDLVIDFERMHITGYPFSLYSLIRAAVESTATAMWLVKPNRMADRVFRALQLSYRNAREGLEFATVLVGPTAAQEAAAGVEKTLDRLEELKNALPPLRQRVLTGPPRYTEILKSVSDPPDSEGRHRISSPFAVWKLSSAFLHGSDQVIRALSDVRQLQNFSDGVATFEITPSFQTQAVSLRTCVDLQVALDERYVALSTRDYAQRPVK